MLGQLTLGNPTDCRLPGSSLHGIFQARILQWVSISPGDLPNPIQFYKIEPESLTSPALAGGFFYHCATWEAHKFKVKTIKLEGNLIYLSPHPQR